MTKQQIIAQLKVDNPTLIKQVNDKVIELDTTEYEATIEAWADAILAKEAKKAEAAAKVQAKSELLEKLGITEDEAKLLLS
jgi:hypothetical protein